MPNDSEIWEGICRGDAAVFDCFYREHAPRLRAFVQQIVGNRHAAEDVAQETFAQVWNRPNGYQPERGALRAYLFGIGRKRASEWWRQQRPAEPVADEAPPCRTETHSLVSDAFQRLPEEQRTLLWLREVEGHSYAELAETLRIPVGTVRSRLFAARETLREIWHSRRTES